MRLKRAGNPGHFFFPREVRLLRTLEAQFSFWCLPYIAVHRNTLPYIAVHYRTSQYIAVHCSTLQYVVVYCRSLPYIAVHCHTSQYIAVCCRTLLYIAVHCRTLLYIAVHCRILQYVAVHCSTPPARMNSIPSVAGSCFDPVSGFSASNGILVTTLSFSPHMLPFRFSGAC